MKDFKVYLAGGISGLKYGDAVNWRNYAAKELAKGKEIKALTDPFGNVLIPKNYEHSHIYAFSPMRAAGFLEPMEGMVEAVESLSTIQAILTRDHWDCKTADAILVNLSGMEKVSIGTVMEIAWAYAYRIPTVIVMEKDNIHRHGMIEQSAGWVVESLDEGIKAVKSILLP